MVYVFTQSLIALVKNNLCIYNKLTYFPCKTWWRRSWVQSRSERKRIWIFLFAEIVFFSRLFTCRIASYMHWEDEFRCISMIFGKFIVILVVFCLWNILEPVSEMRAFFERIVYYSTARLAAEQSETKFPAVSRRQTR
jgi:predicted membrane channel-forming protein YqfA (hemolysin III family)